MTSCSWIRESAPELVLGVLDGAERAEVMSHLETCAACREEVGRLAEGVDALGTLALPIAPSRGFEDRVLHSMGVTAIAERQHPRRRRIITGLSIAAAVIAVVAVIAIRSGDQPVFAESIPMIRITAGEYGQNVGEVSVEGRDVARVTASVSYYGALGKFTLEAMARDGNIFPVGVLTSTDGWLTWSGTIDRDPRDLVGFRVVSSAGQVFCEGVFPE